ncbi:TrkH family potassium uptake protein [Algirhabdus cladophorae]|uniref:TrkH family potassium uptake protein n=1 Tax=Algirhabdus cladophorae TaxID=3377108 RepID=UPI003B84B0FF
MRQPLLLVLCGVVAVAMYVPAIVAFSSRDMHVARAFFYGATLLLILLLLISVAVRSNPRSASNRRQIVALVAAYIGLPVVMAVPFYEGLETTTFVNAYFEMLSSFTTTGATVFDDPSRLVPALHLWRALVGWLGGFLLWLAAVAILAPLNLGGFELTTQTEAGSGLLDTSNQHSAASPAVRLMRHTVHLAPLYVGLSAAIAFLLWAFGDPGLVAITHAMSVMSSSGISAIGGLQNANSGFAGELLLFFMMFLAVSRLTFTTDGQHVSWPQLRQDPEVQLATLLVVGVSAMLFLRHFVGAIDVDAQDNFSEAVLALWGSIFTVLSFLTTTGFESSSWEAARNWSGLPTPGLVLLGLAIIGGGVATTAGGVKLLRIYALYKHGTREVERLVHPSSISTTGAQSRQIRRQGAFIAWVFAMIFALCLAACMLALSLTGLQFETSMVLTVAAMSNAGPLASVAAELPISYAGIPDSAKLILTGAMVLGRLEALALIALLNPEFWRG